MTPQNLADLMTNVNVPDTPGSDYVETRVSWDSQDKRFFLVTEETYRTVGEPASQGMVERRRIPLDAIVELQPMVGQAVQPDRDVYLLITYTVDEPEGPYQFEGSDSALSVLRTIRLGCYTAEEAATIDLWLNAMVREVQNGE